MYWTHRDRVNFPELQNDPNVIFRRFPTENETEHFYRTTKKKGEMIESLWERLESDYINYMRSEQQLLEGLMRQRLSEKNEDELRQQKMNDYDLNAWLWKTVPGKEKRAIADALSVLKRRPGESQTAWAIRKNRNKNSKIGKR